MVDVNRFTEEWVEMRQLKTCNKAMPVMAIHRFGFHTKVKAYVIKVDSMIPTVKMAKDEPGLMVNSKTGSTTASYIHTCVAVIMHEHATAAYINAYRRRQPRPVSDDNHKHVLFLL